MSAIFRGRFEAKIDGKGRLSLPAHLRACLPEGISTLVFTNSQYQKMPCLDVYMPSEWEKLEKKVQRLSSLKPTVQAYQRFYISGGQFVDSDNSDRFLIPKTLRHYAQLEKELILVGMGEKLEIWEASLWSQVHSRLAESFDETLAELSGLEMDQEEGES